MDFVEVLTASLEALEARGVSLIPPVGPYPADFAVAHRQIIVNLISSHAAVTPSLALIARFLSIFGLRAPTKRIQQLLGTAISDSRLVEAFSPRSRADLLLLLEALTWACATDGEAAPGEVAALLCRCCSNPEVLPSVLEDTLLRAEGRTGAGIRLSQEDVFRLAYLATQLPPELDAGQGLALSLSQLQWIMAQLERQEDLSGVKGFLRPQLALRERGGEWEVWDTGPLVFAVEDVGRLYSALFQPRELQRIENSSADSAFECIAEGLIERPFLPELIDPVGGGNKEQSDLAGELILQKEESVLCSLKL
jgi:hypothetical protein